MEKWEISTMWWKGPRVGSVEPKFRQQRDLCPRGAVLSPVLEMVPGTYSTPVE